MADAGPKKVIDFAAGGERRARSDAALVSP